MTVAFVGRKIGNKFLILSYRIFLSGKVEAPYRQYRGKHDTRFPLRIHSLPVGPSSAQPRPRSVVTVGTGMLRQCSAMAPPGRAAAGRSPPGPLPHRCPMLIPYDNEVKVQGQDKQLDDGTLEFMWLGP